MGAFAPRLTRLQLLLQGVSLGVADGVGGWIESGVDPSLFSQALMYHAHRYSKVAWPGEPEVDPTQEYEEREQVEGWELTPLECLESAYGGVLRERNVLAGKHAFHRDSEDFSSCVNIHRIEYRLCAYLECVKWGPACSEVRLGFLLVYGTY